MLLVRTQSGDEVSKYLERVLKKAFKYIRFNFKIPAWNNSETLGVIPVCL